MLAVPQINPEYLRRAAKAPDIATLKQRAYKELKLNTGNYVVDVGCGPAIDTPALAKIVGPTGTVLGIDGDPAMVADANRVSIESGIGLYTKHEVGDATRLAVERNSVDAVYCERVLQHIPYARCPNAVDEMLRVLKPGGRLVIVDTDWATLSIATDNPFLERNIVLEHTRGFQNPYSGRYLPALLREAKHTIDDATFEPIAIRVTYESAVFLLGATIRRSVLTGRMSGLSAEHFASALEGARNYQIWSAHLIMMMATATKRRWSS